MVMLTQYNPEYSLKVIKLDTLNEGIYYELYLN